MTTNALAAALLLSLLGAAAASAQEAAPAQVADDEAEEATTPDTRRPLRVLENPYDISSFYRSSDGLVYGYQGGASERYPIAGFYRQRGGSGYGYSQFWTSGYSGGRRGRVPLAIGFRRAIGENGDLFLFAPAILAPVGPLTGVFFDGITLR
jgi:hypothetical protein